MSSPSRSRRSSSPRSPCSSGKAAWPTYGQALRALREIHAGNAQAVAAVDVASLPRSGYDCPECGEWHLTRQPPSRQTRPWPLT